MKPNSLQYLALLTLLAGGLFLAFCDQAEATQYRTVPGNNSTWYDWNDTDKWEYWYPPWWQWRRASWYGQPPPRPGDEVIIQSLMNIPQGTNVTIGTLRVGNHDCPSGGGWVRFPAYQHVLRVQGSLTVTRNTYVRDDTLEIDGGTMINNGALFVGNNTGYQYPTTNALSACRQSCPRLVMKGATASLTCRYSATATSSNFSGGLIFFPGSVEEITEGDLHIEGWLIGASDRTCPYSPTPRLFDLTDPPSSSAHVYLDGTGYPNGTIAMAYVLNENNGAETLRFHDLTVDRPGPGDPRISLCSPVEVVHDFSFLNGQLQSPAALGILFQGPLPGACTVVGNSSYLNIYFDLNSKTGPLTLRSSCLLADFTLNNPNPGFVLQIHPLGATTRSFTILDGRMTVSSGTLDVQGFFRVGSSNPPLQPGQNPVLDMAAGGTLQVRDVLGGANHGDFFFEHGAAGSWTGGAIRVEGDFLLDNANVSAGGTHTVEMTGNAGREVRIGNNQVPPGKVNPTLILQNLTISKTGNFPGDTVNVVTDLIVLGTLNRLSGVLNWNTGGIGSLAIREGSGNPGDSAFPPGTKDIPVLHLDISTDSQEGVKISSLACTVQGTGNPSSEIAGAFLYRDEDRNGVFDPTVDLLLAGPSFHSTSDNTFKFMLSRILPETTSESWFVVCDLYVSARVGSTFSFGLASAADVATTGVLSNRTVSVSGLPIQGGEFTVADPASPPPPRSGGGCAKGASASGPEVFLGWVLLTFAFGLGIRKRIYS